MRLTTSKDGKAVPARFYFLCILFLAITTFLGTEHRTVKRAGCCRKDLHPRWRMIPRQKVNITVAGYLDSVFGVAESGRRVADVLAAADFGVGTYSFQSSHHWTVSTSSVHPRVNHSGRVNIVNVNAAEIQGVMDSAPQIFRPQPGFYPVNVAVWYWELETFPIDKLGNCTRDVAAVFAATEFIRQSVAGAVSVPVVRIVLPPPFMPVSDFDWRAKLGLRPSTTLFLFNFDYLSYVRRKNPDAVVEAFKQAFTDLDDAALVIKSVHASKR